MSIRFHLDENMPHAVADGLRNRGVDVTTTTDAQLMGASDKEQLAFARSEGRVVVTRDADFLRISARGEKHPGLVFWTERRSVGQLISALDLLRVSSTADDVEDQVFFR